MVARWMYFIAALAAADGSAAVAQQQLPVPSERPLEIDFSGDPILRLRNDFADLETFRTVIETAVLQHPAIEEAEALEEEAETLVDQARAARLPSVDASVSSYRVISREFSNDPENILERSRPEQRTDALLQVQQTLVDFGVGAKRVRAAGARLRAAAADSEDTSNRVALNSIAAWYDVFGYRALVSLAEAFLASQRELRASFEERIRQGASAQGDLARVDSYIAKTQTRLAGYVRFLAQADSRFTELTGAPPPRRPWPGAAAAASRQQSGRGDDGLPGSSRRAQRRSPRRSVASGSAGHPRRALAASHRRS